MRALACAAAFMGGACWIARVLLEEPAAEAAFWVGAVLLAVAVLGLGLQAVPTAPTWLQVVVGLGSLGLAGSVLAAVRAEADAAMVDAVAGGLTALVFGVLALRWFSGPPAGTPARATGSHRR